MGTSVAPPLYTDPAGTPVPLGSAGPIKFQSYPSSWQDSALIDYVTRTSGGTLTSTQETSSGKPHGTLLGRDWTAASDNLKYSAAIYRNTAGQVEVIQCYASGQRIADSVNFLANCLGDSVPDADAATARSWASTQAKALIADVAGSPKQIFTSPQPRSATPAPSCAAT